MTWPNPRRATPVARVSRSALLSNARLLARDPGAVADLRRDAWGHGIELVAAVVAEAGIRSVAADERDAAAVTSTGLALVQREPSAGELLYGMPGSGGEPALTLAAPVLSTKRLLAGEGVSYGYTHRAQADTRVALIAGGYAEGVVRALGNRVGVELAGDVRPIVGRVAMDVCVIDIGDAPVQPGDEAVYFGSGLVRDGLAAWTTATGLTPAELVCAVGLHVEREVSG
ncbi:alanine racemase [Microbacterium sp. JZ31]|uniref:alanine racemase n=1 Tax=Microbacterium sp. JZ31 TaxID=1906274 RepID=UPI0019312A66|nr:alanine racemase C-terminal domain-containing protein [Microbacterium sp. JZ31]